MSEFAIVLTRLHRDAAYRELSRDGRLLFLWTWTNPDAAIGGLYRCSPRQMARAFADPDSPDSEERLLHDVYVALDELARKPLVAYDYDNEVVWVLARARHANRSAKAAQIIVKEFDRCPESPLRDAFLERYARELGL